VEAASRRQQPAKHFAKYTEHKRERFLSAAEFKQLGEIMKLRWKHVDIEGAILRLPDSKAGAKAVHLGPPAVDVLAATGRLPFNPHVIASTFPRPAALRPSAVLVQGARSCGDQGCADP
jgi:integrase